MTVAMTADTDSDEILPTENLSLQTNATPNAANNNNDDDNDDVDFDHHQHCEDRRRSSVASRADSHRRSRLVIRKFQKLDATELSCSPAPDVKIGQRVAYKEYYGNEFGTIRWIGRVPQICPDWTVGIEFDNAIGEGDGSLNGRRYFIAKDCFAKFLPLNSVALVDQHVGRPEPGTMISVMSAAVRPGQMISIQRVSTVHVQHCFLNAPHRIPGADILATNTRLHCQCPNCGPCAHVIKPPRTQRLPRSGKNATHMCQFSTYTCCGMESSEEAMCTYTGNRISSLPPPCLSHSNPPMPPVGNSWIEGAGYLTNLQAQQTKLMPDEYKLGAAREDIGNPRTRRHQSKSSSKQGSGRHRKHKQDTDQHSIHHRPPSSNDLDAPEGSIARVSPENFAPRPASAQSAVSDNDHSTMQLSALPYSPKSQQNNEQAMVVCSQDKVVAPEEANCYGDDAKIIARSAKVVYRDSIENRYLFPTDDPIDSTLEADLENLSQARYGHCNSSRITGSRNIFKSLRSLVSCLSAQSNYSDHRGYPERNLKFSGHGEKYANKSMPTIVPTISSPCENEYDNVRHSYCKHSDCGSSRYQKAPKDDEGPPTEVGKAIARQISSSSDCGFSSASQNSMNFQSHNSCSPVISMDEERKTNQIYRRIIEKLINSGSVTSSDLPRIKRIFHDAHFSRCYLHDCVSSNIGDPSDLDQMIADIIHKSLSQQEHCYDQRTSNSRCHATNFCLSNHRVDVDKTDEQYRKLPNGYEPYQISASQGRYNTGRVRDGSTASGSITLSSNESSCGVGDQQTPGVDPFRDKSIAGDKQPEGSLPKSFELKLTLSINSDEKNAHVLVDGVQGISSDVCKRDGKKILGNSASSGLNISISSAQKGLDSQENLQSTGVYDQNSTEMGSHVPTNQGELPEELNDPSGD